MKKRMAALLSLVLLTGCGAAPEPTVSETVVVESAATEAAPTAANSNSGSLPTAASYVSRFDSVTQITLSDNGIQVDGGGETDAVFTSRDIVYYENRTTYDSGNPYGEGEKEDQHTAEEARMHTVVNITKPGAYRVSGKLSAGQIRVDLGEDASEDTDAVVELILDNADITCTVAPAILFLNVYECDETASAETASPDVDTTAAGANLILEGSNTVTGSHVARIFKDTDAEKKLWKQDGAIYSYMSMNVFGPGALELTADNEGLDTELHLTIHGGDISIYSGNDGINTNEDGVSVTTILGGNVTIFAGLGEEGDGIDSNGYLVIRGGNVFSAAKPESDAGLDSDLGSYIHGGTVISLGSTMDWAESDSRQGTMNLQFAARQKAGSTVTVKDTSGSEIFSFTVDGEYARDFSGLILSHPDFRQGETYEIFVDGQQMAYTGTDVGRGGPGGRAPDGMMPPQGEHPKMPEGMEPPQGERPQMPEGQRPNRPEFDDDDHDDWDDRKDKTSTVGTPRTDFFMNDKVNAFSGVTTA